MAQELSSGLIGPAYDTLATDSETLHLQTVEFCDQPTEGALASTITDLDKVAAGWHQSAVFRFGPTEWRRSKNEFGTEFDPSRIQSLIEKSEVDKLDADYLSTRSSTTQRGLGAAYYLLDATGDRTPDVSDITSRRCGYLEAVTESIKIEAAALNAEWNTSWNGGDPYRITWASDSPEMAIDDLVNNSIFVLEEIQKMQLGPMLESEPTSEISDPIDDITVENSIAGVRNVLFEAEDNARLVNLVSTGLAERLRKQTDAVVTEMNGLPKPIGSAAKNAPNELRRFTDAVNTLTITLSTELASELGVTLSFSDADGDSG